MLLIERGNIREEHVEEWTMRKRMEGEIWFPDGEYFGKKVPLAKCISLYTQSDESEK